MLTRAPMILAASMGKIREMSAVSIKRDGDGRVGLWFQRPNGASSGPFEITSLVPEGAADQSRVVKVGDMFSAVNGQDVCALSDAAVAALFKGPPSVSLTLNLCANGENGVVSAAGETGVAPAAAAAREEHKVPAAVLEAEDSLLTFWMMRGGGESGDAAVAPWFRPDGAAPRTLDAEQLGAIVREKLNEDLDPVHDEKLHGRLLGGSGAAAGVLDEAAMRAWLRCRFPRFQVNQMLKDFDMRTPVLNQLLGVEPREDGLEHFSSRTKEDVRHALERAASELVDGLYAIIDTVKAGMGQTQGSSVNLKFAGDLGTSGTFEGKYETGKVFDEGLEKYIGLPDPKVWKFCVFALKL